MRQLVCCRYVFFELPSDVTFGGGIIMTLEQAELVLEEKEKYSGPVVERASNIVMEDFYLDEVMRMRRE